MMLQQRPGRIVTRWAGAVCVLAVAALAHASAITRPQNWQVIQRKGRSADVPIALTLDGGGTVEARVVGDGNVIVPWRQCGSAKRGGPFKTMLKSVPQGGWYTLEVRVGEEVLSVPNVGVGIIVAVIGQSNASGYSGGPPYVAPSALTSVYRASGVFEPLQDPVGRPDPQGELTEKQKADPEIRKFLSPSKEFKQATNYLDWNCSASCWPEFSARLAEHCRVPVMIVCGARGATSSAQWLPEKLRDPSWCNGLYDHMVARVNAVGGTVSAVIVNQGEQDCTLNERAYDDWIKNTRAYVSAFRKDLADPNLPFLFVQIGVYSEWTPAVRRAIDDFCAQDGNSHLAACAYDLPGGIHYAKSGMTILARRLVDAYRNVVLSERSVRFRGPRAVKMELAPERDRITVAFDEPVKGLEGRNQFLDLQYFTDRDTLEWGKEIEPTDALRARLDSVSFSGNRMVVKLKEPVPKDTSDITLRYAWLSKYLRKYPGALLHGAGENALPVMPFNLQLKVQ